MNSIDHKSILLFEQIARCCSIHQLQKRYQETHQPNYARFRNRSLRRAFSVLSMVDDDYAFDKSKTGKNAIFPGENVNVDNDSTQKHIAKRSGDSVTLGQWIKLRMFTNYSRHYFLQHALRMTRKANKDKAGNAMQTTFTVESKAKILFNCVDDDDDNFDGFDDNIDDDFDRFNSDLLESEAFDGFDVRGMTRRRMRSAAICTYVCMYVCPYCSI